MNSEKVKEIKKALEDNAKYEHFDKLGYIDGYKCKTVTYADILTLINELESENDTLHTNLCEWRKENQQLKNRIAELESENETLRNAKVVYENVDYCYEDLKKAEKRIAELEKENARLLDSVETVQNNRCVYKCELTKKQLKQFAEKLKERCYNYYPSIDHYCCSEKAVNVKDIDELLKECEE